MFMNILVLHYYPENLYHCKLVLINAEKNIANWFKRISTRVNAFLIGTSLCYFS